MWSLGTFLVSRCTARPDLNAKRAAVWSLVCARTGARNLWVFFPDHAGLEPLMYPHADLRGAVLVSVLYEFTPLPAVDPHNPYTFQSFVGGFPTSTKHCARCGKEGGLSCGGCSLAYYCDKDTCQLRDWPAHRRQCGLRARAADRARSALRRADARTVEVLAWIHNPLFDPHDAMVEGCRGRTQSAGLEEIYTLPFAKGVACSFVLVPRAAIQDLWSSRLAGAGLAVFPVDLRTKGLAARLEGADLDACAPAGRRQIAAFDGFEGTLGLIFPAREPTMCGVEM